MQKISFTYNLVNISSKMSFRALSPNILRTLTPYCRGSVRPASLVFYRASSTKKFTEKHEWVSVDNGVGTVGITNYAQEALGDVVFIELPVVGKKYKQAEQIGAIESVKAASDIYAPVSGEVVEVNSKLEDEPSHVNKSAEKDGWIAKLNLKDTSELDKLMDESGYVDYVKNLDH